MKIDGLIKRKRKDLEIGLAREPRERCVLKNTMLGLGSRLSRSEDLSLVSSTYTEAHHHL